MIVDAMQSVTAASRIGSSLRSAWRAVLHVSFLVLCVRFLIATFNGSDADIWSSAALAAGSMALGAWRPRAALFAFTVIAVLLIGLAQSPLLTCPSPPTLVFCAIWLGIAARALLLRWTQPRRRGHEKDDEAGHESVSYEQRRHSTASTGLDIPQLVTDLLITATLLSLFVQVWPLAHRSGFQTAFWTRSVFGFPDEYYFLGSAFLWLQGLFYFRLLTEQSGFSGITNTLQSEATEREMRAAPSACWITSMFLVCIGVLTASFLFQTIFHVPTKPKVFAGIPLENTLPFEDWHAFGSIAASVFAYTIATRTWRTRANFFLKTLTTILLLVFVVASWSRAAWMAAVIAILLFLGRKLPLRWTALVLAVVVAAILVLHWANNDAWTPERNPVLYRLGNLAKIDQPRLDLYHKAFGMLQERPLLGHGIGMSYRASVKFARPGDPLAAVPDFMHNFLLQIATEQGVIVAAAYAGLIIWILWNGLRLSTASNALSPDSPRTVVWGATLALATYLVTQLTANSLNIYISNQFFFWFLMAALLCAARSDMLFRWNSDAAKVE